MEVIYIRLRKRKRKMKVIENVTKRVLDHANQWIDKDDHYWFERLSQEVGEIGGTIAGDHEGPLELELEQVAGICLNWLRRMEREGRY
jgi:hypothetical protein